MKVIEAKLYCDSCNKEIQFRSGYAIHGNIGVATTNDQFLGLIGNNFPECNAKGMIQFDQIRTTHLCESCFLNAVKITNLGEH